jgi:hypothetical protein
MTASVHQLIEPSLACRRLGHRIEQRARTSGAGHWDYCYVCSLGYEKAMSALGDEAKADRFVQFLRRG